jgi:hypothetical protein
MKDLFIYHAGTGTTIYLNDEVYLVDSADLDSDAEEAFEYGMMNIPVQLHKGIRIDNYNMTNFLEG